METAVKLSQWDAIVLETLRVHQWSDDELIRRVKSGDLPQDKSKFKAKYDDLTKLANEQSELFELAVKQGYQIKFSTLRGTHSWISLALQIKGKLKLDAGQEAIIVPLSDEEKAKIEQTISLGWHIVAVEAESHAEAGDKKLYRIEPVNRELV